MRKKNARNYEFTGSLAVLAFILLPSAVLAQRAQEDPRPQAGGLLPALDANRDGEISTAEMENAAAALKALDANKDGKLSREEIGAAQPRGREGSGGGRPSGGETPLATSAPLAAGDREKGILAVLDDLDRNQRSGMMNVPKEDGRLLRLLTESIGARNVVEIGSSNGYSGIWICLALSKTGGKLTTHDIDARRSALARENFKRAGVDKLVTLVEGDAHEEVKKLKEPIDLLFSDADKSGYLDYLEKLLPLVRPGGLIVSHNMRRPEPDPRYIKAITTNPDLETLFLNMDAAGIAVTLKKR
ncbi:MAG: O-methyltransferase [Planctomycetes bacterium]|nr:O-methyltransferase [Planctomycetota bacterium]